MPHITLDTLYDLVLRIDAATTRRVVSRIDLEDGNLVVSYSDETRETITLPTGSADSQE